MYTPCKFKYGVIIANGCHFWAVRFQRDFVLVSLGQTCQTNVSKTLQTIGLCNPTHKSLLLVSRGLLGAGLFENWVSTESNHNPWPSKVMVKEDTSWANWRMCTYTDLEGDEAVQSWCNWYMDKLWGEPYFEAWGMCNCDENKMKVYDFATKIKRKCVVMDPKQKWWTIYQQQKTMIWCRQKCRMISHFTFGNIFYRSTCVSY